MRITYIHQYFNLPEEGPCRSYYIASYLSKKGFIIDLVTSHNSKSKTISINNNFTVHYIKNRYSQKMNNKRRILSFLMFSLLSTIYIFRHLKPQVIYATSTPLSIAIPALLLNKFKKIPFVFEVRDLWPLIPTELNILKSNFIIRLSLSLEKAAYSNANLIIALSKEMKNHILKKGGQNVQVITNMCFQIAPSPRKHNPSSPYNICYFGALGEVNGLNRIVSLATKNPKCNFHIIGKGSQKEKLINTQLKNLKTIDFMQRSDLKEYLNMDNCIALISFLNHSILSSTCPNKFFESLSLGLPILVNYKGWISDLVEEKKCGFIVDDYSKIELVDQYNQYSKNSIALSHQFQIDAQLRDLPNQLLKIATPC